MAKDFEPIRIVELIASKVGSPKNDGTAGSGLYSVPFKLSAPAPSEWAEFFVYAWDHPSSYSLMHRPHIAKVYGNQVTLDGTTIEEVEQVHQPILKLTCDEANKNYVALLEKRRLEEEKAKVIEEAHRKNVEDASKRIKFD